MPRVARSNGRIFLLRYFNQGKGQAIQNALA